MAISMSNLQLAGCMPCLLNRKSLTCLDHMCNLGINYFTLVLCYCYNQKFSLILSLTSILLILYQEFLKKG